MFSSIQSCLWAIGLAALLGGCTSFSPDGGFKDVQQTTQARTGLSAAWPRSPAEQQLARQRTDALLLRQPLSVDDAVQIALLNNQGLQASYQELGISEADRVQASRLPNPSISFGRLRQGEGVELDRGLHFDLSRLLLAPWVSGIESRRFEQARWQATAETLTLAARTRQAWFAAVATDESVRYGRQVLSAAEAGQDLAANMVKAGNWNQLDLAREQGFRSDAALGLMQAIQRQTVAHEQLGRLMGLSDLGAVTLPERLPDLPKAPDDLPGIEQRAVDGRLDLKALKARTAGLAKSLGLSKATRMVDVLEVGGVRNSFKDAPRETGYDVTLQIPLFDWGEARVARAEAVYLQSAQQLAQAVVEARSEVRQAYQGYRASHEIARHYRDEVVPLRKRISTENQLRYNGMLISVFDLLADSRAQVAAVQGYIDALRDFWLADSELQMALVGKGPTLSRSTP